MLRISFSLKVLNLRLITVAMECNYTFIIASKQAKESTFLDAHMSLLYTTQFNVLFKYYLFFGAYICGGPSNILIVELDYTKHQM